MSTNSGQGLDSYWDGITGDVSSLADTSVKVVELPERSNEVSTTYGVTFEGIDECPLFAYLSIPSNGSTVPLFQVPGYGSVVPVPAYERRERYIVMALCHRGQRLSDSRYSAAYPGLLTEGLPGSDGYMHRYIVADCLRGLDVLKKWDGVDDSKLAVSGNDLAALLATIYPGIASTLVSSPLLFTDLAARLTTDEDYPLQEFNDFRRANPGDWTAATETLGLFDPLARASNIEGDVLVACSGAEKPAAGALVKGISGNGRVYVNAGRGYVDHKFQEDWLADQSGVARGAGPFLTRV